MKPVYLCLCLCLCLLIGCNGNTDKDDESGVLEEDCAETCRSSSGGPPVNDCLPVGGDDTCVYTCSSDDDCLDPFYVGCSAETDDGTAICELAT